MTTEPGRAPWYLHCPWCSASVEVNARGQRGGDPGAGVEASDLMRLHIEAAHGKTWADFLERLYDD